MYTVYRSWLKYGNETDEVCLTIKDFSTFEKALSYGKRYAKGVRFVSFSIEDETAKEIYYENSEGVIVGEF